MSTFDCSMAPTVSSPAMPVPGVAYSGVPEFEFNVRLASEVAKKLEEGGLRVRMIGEKGNMIFLNHRTRAAKGADLFLSIHHDSAREHLHVRRHDFAGFSLFVSRTTVGCIGQ